MAQGPPVIVGSSNGLGWVYSINYGLGCWKYTMTFTVSNGNGSPLIVCFYQSILRWDRTGRNPTDRGKLGTKRNVLTDQKGVPLSAVITAANIHDMKAATETLDSIVIKRPRLQKYRGCSTYVLTKGMISQK